MPQVIAAAALVNWGLGALVSAGVVSLGTATLTAVSFAVGQYQAYRAREKARDAYNATLKDRMVMTATVDRARSRVYGRVRTVDGILFKSTWGPMKEFYTFVIALAGHEIDGIEQIYFADKPVSVDGNGNVLDAPYNANDKATRNASIPAGSASVTLPEAPANGSVSMVAETPSGDVIVAATVVGNVISSSLHTDKVRRIVYQTGETRVRARVRLYNGGDGQDLSAGLAADMPGLIIPGKHRFAGIACLRVDMAYSQESYPNGPPNPITAVVRGAKVLDPRLNRIPNPDFAGAAVGLFPAADIELLQGAGVSVSVVALRDEEGMACMDLRIQGTAAANTQAGITFAPRYVRPAASAGQAWHAGIHTRLVAGATAGGLYLALRGMSAANAQVDSAVELVPAARLAATGVRRGRTVLQHTLAGAGIAAVEHQLFYQLMAGQAIDATIRVALPTLALGADPIRWTENPPLCARDWALYPNGGGLAPADLWGEDFATRASACEVTHDFTSVNQDGAAVVTTRPLYACGMVCDTAADPTDSLSEICEAMAGEFAWPGGRLTVSCGVWEAPAGTITSDWLSDKGSIDGVKDGPLAQLVNVITPTIADAAKGYVAAPMPRVVAEAYVEEDGGEEPQDEQYLAVTDADHAAHIAGVRLRTLRAARSYRLPCKLLALQCKLFQTWAINIPEIGLTGEPYRIVKWELDLAQGLVWLSIKANPASITDPDASFRREDAIPNTGLPNPFAVPAVDMLPPESGTAHLVKGADGTIRSRLCVKWAAVQDEAVRNHLAGIEVRCGPIGTDPVTWPTFTAPGSDTQLYVDNVRDYRAYSIIARCRNRLVAGPWGAPKTHVVVGKTEVPAAVGGLVLSIVPGALKGRRTRSTEADWAGTHYRFGESFEAGQPVPGTVDRDGFVWPSPFLGAVKIWAADFDSSGNIGPSVMATTTVDSRALQTNGNALNKNPACTDPTAWALDSEVGLFTGTSAAGAIGTSYISSSTGSNKKAWTAEAIPIDPAKRYAFTANMMAVPGNVRPTYLAVRMFRADGSELSDAGWGGGGVAGYTFGGVLPADGVWRTYGNVFGRGTVRPTPADACFVKVGIWFQEGPAGPPTVGQVAQDVRLAQAVGYLEVDTDNLAPGAATDVLVVRETAPISLVGFGNNVINSVTFTPNASGKVVLTLRGNVDHTMGDATAAVRAIICSIQRSGSFTELPSDDSKLMAAGESRKVPLSFNTEFDVVAGVPVTFLAYAAKNAVDVAVVQNSTLRLEFIKR